MDCIRQNSFNDLLRPLMDIHILVVDDDATTLSLVSAMLKTLTYKVMSVKNPLDALAALRTQKGLIDLVVTDLYMPYMNGFQLQEQIEKEFTLPVIVMSADDKDTVLLQSAQSGVSFFIQKPVSLNDLKNVWQYAIKYKKGKSVVTQETNISNHDDIVTNQEQVGQLDVVHNVGESSGSVASEKENIPFDPNKINNQHIIDDMGIDSNNKNNGSPGSLVSASTGHHNTDNHQVIKKGRKNKKKVVWTNSLHNRFLLAIGHLSLDNAVPKKILEFMNIPGLTRENVASHLQKYRLFLKKVAEKELLNVTKTQVLTNRMSRSTFATGYPQELALKSLRTSSRDRTPFQPFNQSYAPYNYNINTFNHNIWPSSSSPPCFIMSNKEAKPATNYVAQHRPIHLYDRSIYETNHLPVSLGGDFMVTNPSTYLVNNTNMDMVAAGVANNDPCGLVNNNCNYSNGFKHSSAFNGIVQNPPDYNSITGSVRGPLLSSTNSDAPYYNYINGAASIIGSLTGMSSTKMNNGSGVLLPNNGNCMDEMSTIINFAGNTQKSQLFETPRVPSSLYGFGSGDSSSGINPSLIQPIVSPSNVSYLQQQNIYNYIQPSPVAAPSPPTQSPLQQQYSHDAFQKSEERYSNVGGDYQMVDRVINNKGTSTNYFAEELPVSNNVDDIDGDVFLDQLNNLSPLNFQVEVMNPSPENQNPVVDQLSGNIADPYLVQENKAPAINTNGQSFIQQQGIEEVLDPTDQFVNFPTNKLNEMDWDEFLENMLDNKYPGPLE